MRMGLLWGTIGVVLLFVITRHWFEMTPVEALQMAIVSNVLGFFDLMIAVEGQNIPWVRKHLLVGGKSVWLFFLVFYFGGMALFFPILRDLKNYLILALPLIWTPAFAVLAFGPPRDWLVHNRERRQRLRVPPTGGDRV